RSDVKFLEYAAHGVAGVYADLEPYRSVRHDETGLLYRDEAELLRHLDALAADPGLRRRIRSQAHEYVSRHRRIEQHVGRRLEFYRDLLPQPPEGVDLPNDVVAAANANDRYLQLRPREAERTLIAAAPLPATKDKADSLERLT